jgi:hypothetical protein
MSKLRAIGWTAVAITVSLTVVYVFQAIHGY